MSLFIVGAVGEGGVGVGRDEGFWECHDTIYLILLLGSVVF